jgi:hypothetical protein
MAKRRRRITAHQRALLGAVQGAAEAIREAEAEREIWVRRAREARVTVAEIMAKADLPRQTIYDILSESSDKASGSDRIRAQKPPIRPQAASSSRG